MQFLMAGINLVKKASWPLAVPALLLVTGLSGVLLPGMHLELGQTQTAPAPLAIVGETPYTQVALSSWEDIYLNGVRQYRRGEYARGAASMRQVLAYQPQMANAQYYLALCLDLLDQKAQALPYYQAVSMSQAESEIRAYAKTRLMVIGKALGVSDNLMLSSASALAPSGLLFPNNTGRKIQNRIVKLKSNRNALMVEATLINRKTGQQAHGTFILDTGATYTSISRELADSLGLDMRNGEKVHITTANGRIDVPKVVIDQLRIDGVAAQNVEATVIDVRPDSTFSGLLGLSFIRQFKMTIDPVENQLVFESR